MNLFFLLTMFTFFVSCTMTFTNISTNGKAEDVVDENLKADANVSPDIDTSVVP